MVLGLKPGRPEQVIKDSYRPITIQEIPAKGFEAAIARHYDKALEKNPLHPFVMAYRKGISIGMALFVTTETSIIAQE